MINFPSKATTLEVVFEHNPPFQMIDENGNGYGPVYDFAIKLITHAQLAVRLNGKPWARIMVKDAKKPNTLILSISKIPQRIPNFIWLTSVYTGQPYIWRKRNAIDPKNKSIQVSMERNSHREKSIKEYFHSDNVFEFLNSTQALNALLKGRVQRFVATTFAVSGKLASLGYELNILEQLSLFDEAEFSSQGLYLTLTLGTDKEIQLALKQALKHPEIIEARNSLFDSFHKEEQALLRSQSK
ncbi:transporter substrate-binding domain-containing protein [Colwellia sp. 75C3]|uniref:transporter substrate-binding domain-containing protein n=1 Tax=Colwellia sp. 75C3 TaxID=888425 RepID=UPI0012FEE54A|nr:transporter substrate-binding domain-containing protein [Colwellia sp. 75C3]